MAARRGRDPMAKAAIIGENSSLVQCPEEEFALVLGKIVPRVAPKWVVMQVVEVAIVGFFRGVWTMARGDTGVRYRGEGSIGHEVPESR